MDTLKSLFLVFLTLSFFSVTSHAQKALSEVTLHYKISIEPVNDKSSTSRSLDGADLSVYIRGTASRTDMTSSLGTESSIFNTKTGNGFILKEYSGQKLMITLNKDNWAQKNKNFQNMKFNIEAGYIKIG